MQLLMTQQMNQIKSFSKNWLSLEGLPILLYFGSILIMSSVFCAFRFFNRNKRSLSNAEKKRKNSDGHISHFRSACRAVFSRCLKHKFNLNKDNKYFINKNTETNHQKLNSVNDEETTLNIKKTRDDRLSKINHLSVDDEFVEKQQSRSNSPAALVNREEASLTQIVIAQIEHDNNERNRKVIESTMARQFPQSDANLKSSLDKHQGGKSVHLASTPVDADNANACSKNTEQLIQHKLNVPLGLSESDATEEDPIYDVPPSKSLINLNSNADEEISLQKQHHIQVNSDLAYFHTSSPNIFLSVAQEESIYDTPSTRSLAV